MKAVLFALLCCASLRAQNVSFFIDNGNNQLQALASAYQFPDTPVGGSSSIVVRVVNSSNTGVLVGAIYVGLSANSSANDPNFTVTGWAQNTALAPGGWQEFTLNFIPLTSGPMSGYMQAVENTTITSVSTVQGTGTPGIALTCSGPLAQCNGNPFNNAVALNFGNVPSGTVSSITFTLTNQTSTSLSTPAVTLQTQADITSAFALDASALPSAIAANASANFTLTFAPIQSSTLLQATLLVGSNTYRIAGAPVGGLEISYANQTGVRFTPSSSSINFGTANSTATLTFAVTNPIASTSPAVVSVAVSGAGFALSGAPATATKLQPGESLPDFQLIFTPAQPGSYTGALTIGTQVFTLTARVPSAIGGPGSPLPDIDLICGASPCKGQTFTSQQQVNLSVQLPSPAPSQSIFTLGMTFKPSISGVNDDPSIQFISPISTRTLNMNMPAGGKTATYNGNSQLTFQTGTTAGTITFTLSFLGQTATWTITIPPADVQITSSLAQRQSPNLVVTLNGYDNTYSTGQLSFTFYDTSGRVIASGIQVDASSDFHQYFFGPADAGGTFALQANFPVTGDVTQVGAVAVTLTNSAGSTTTANQPFQ